jgi:hypothetical protein
MHILLDGTNLVCLKDDDTLRTIDEIAILFFSFFFTRMQFIKVNVHN